MVIILMHRNMQLLCCVTGTNNVVGQLYFKQTHGKKRSDLWLSEAGGRGGREGELDDGSQKVQTSSYKYKDVMYMIRLTLP